MDKPGVTPLIEVGKKSLRFRNLHIRGAISEFFGTLIVGFMCVGAGSQFLIKTKGGMESQVVPVLGIILGIMIAIVITGGISGGEAVNDVLSDKINSGKPKSHVNPAVSIALAIAGELSWYSLPGYVISQFLGAFVGALLGWGLIHPTIRQTFSIPNNWTIAEFDMYNSSGIAGIFSPIKSPGCTLINGLATECVLTCLLIMTLCGVVDKQSAVKPPGYLIPIVIPLVIAAFCFTFESPSGTLLNPARDMGPRLAAWVLGWKSEKIFLSVDWDGNQQHWWIVGLFGPILGGILGAILYSFIIGPQVCLEQVEATDGISQQEKNAIKQILGTSKAAGGGTNWRDTVFIPRSIPPSVTNISPYTTTYNGYVNSNNNNNNNSIHPTSETYQHNSLPYQGAYYPNQGYHDVKG